MPPTQQLHDPLQKTSKMNFKVIIFADVRYDTLHLL